MEKTVNEMRVHARAQANQMRERARATALKRKEEYLGARVPKALRAKVIAQAEAQGLPVSILIRNILEQAFANDGLAAVNIEQAKTIPDGNTPGVDFPQVIGWEQITLNRALRCTACDRVIQAGSKVTLGLSGPGEEHVILCRKCKQDN